LGEWLCRDCWQSLALVRTPLCYRCGRLSPNFKICDSCRQTGGLSRLIFCGYWQDPLRRLILNLKYRRLRVLANYLVELMVEALALTDAKIDLVVPVPLHWRKWWERGFNQADVLARGIAKRLDVKMVDPIIRRRYTKPQFGLIRSIRQSNVKEAFNLKPGRRGVISGKIILLVDDVVATGSTVEECAKVLRREGAKQVWGLVIARA
jgi:competence protein ComFC